MVEQTLSIRRLIGIEQITLLKRGKIIVRIAILCCDNVKNELGCAATGYFSSFNEKKGSLDNKTYFKKVMRGMNY